MTPVLSSQESSTSYNIFEAADTDAPAETRKKTSWSIGKWMKTALSLTVAAVFSVMVTYSVTIIAVYTEQVRQFLLGA